jgi:hypothetical protein
MRWPTAVFDSIFSAASVVTPARLPLSTSAFFTHSWSVGGEQPIFSAIETTVAVLSLPKGQWIIRLVVQHHPDCSFPHLEGKLVRCLAHIGSFYSRVGASGNPGAVQRDVFEVQIKDRDEAIERLKDMKARLSTKMVGETLDRRLCA